MQQFPPVNEIRPYGVVDLTDQSTMLLVLEELGIAHLQDEWLRTHTPEAPDAAQAAEQHEEFFEDLCAILEGQAGPDRVEPNGWAGAKLASHLRAAMPEVLAVPTLPFVLITMSLLRRSGPLKLRFLVSRHTRKKSKRKALRRIRLNTFSS